MQRTISQPVRFSGVGLHSGHKVNVKLLPHHAHGGIVFRRVDVTPSIDIPAQANLVSDTTLSSGLTVNIQGENFVIRTVEHIMSALAGLGIDNIIIEVTADEIPIMDGSAAPFIRALQSAGIQEQTVAKRFLKVVKPVKVTLEDKFATLTPYDGFRLNFEIDFNHPAFKPEHQRIEIDMSSDNFIDMISEARTFGFLKDIEYLRANQLALGGSLENAIVIDEEKVLNNDGLRFDDEFVRHKVLDAVGDLYLAGFQILANFTAFKSGHHLNNLLVRELLSDSSNYELIDIDSFNTSPITYSNCLAVAEAS